MKKVLLIVTCFAFLFSFNTQSQTTANLVIFSEDGEPFYAIINGVKQNQKAETNVKFTDITPNISLRIEFEDKALPALKQNMALEPGFEHTARIKRDKKKQLKLRYFGSVPLAESTTGNMQAVGYHTAEETADNTNVEAGHTNGNSVTSTTTSIQTQTRQNNSQGAVNISTPGVSMSIPAVPSSSSAEIQSSTSTTVTQTTTTYSQPNNTVTTRPNTTLAPVGCATPMSHTGFNKMKQTIQSKPFSDTKMSTAKIATKGACLSVHQIKEICKLFSMDEDKLAYAKYAYDSCVEKNNYYQVSDVFAFSTTTEDLNKFLGQ